MTSLTVFPHAKINLGLRILGVRSDGYHELWTRFQTIDLTDEMEIRLAPGGLELSVEGSPLPGDASNLVLRAAEALREGRHGLPGARIHLRKRIPLAGGLGGGSSDAAATLLALNRLWNIHAETAELGRLGSRLGADIPFFLHGGTALGTGKGDEIQLLSDLSPYRIGLILPPFGSSTAEVYRLWDAQPAPPSSQAPSPPRAFPSAIALEDGTTVQNDLQDLVFRKHPELALYRDLLLEAGAVAASLSGSGPSVFGLFEREDAVRALQTSRDWGAVRVLSLQRVTRREYSTRLGLPAPPRLPGTP